MGNPRELAGELLNRSFYAMKTTALRPRRATSCSSIRAKAPTPLRPICYAPVCSGTISTIVFTRARITTELVYRWATQSRPGLAGANFFISGGYLPPSAAQIEQALNGGQLKGVVATSAWSWLDIGGLDICVLVGYPGSIINTWQRAGRVGRAGRESLILLIGLPTRSTSTLCGTQGSFLGAI